MQNERSFFGESGRETMQDILSGVKSITITRTGAVTSRIEPVTVAVRLEEEHPPVDRMEGDWGAICEIYKQRSDHFLAIAGVSLQAGDVVTFDFDDPHQAFSLRVTEIDHGRASVSPVTRL